MNRPLIDVIIVVYNGEKFIKEAVESARNQTWNNLNIIIVDDGSTDTTLQILRELSAQDSRIRVIERAHAGISASLNAAVRQSTADYIAFLDSDDLWHPQKLEKQIESLDKNGTDISFCVMEEFETFAEGTSTIFKARPGRLKGFLKLVFLGKRSLFDTFGLFNETIKTGDFIEWFSRVRRAGNEITMLDEVLAYRRVHSHNITGSTSKNAFLEVLKIHMDEKRKNNETLTADGSD